MTREETKKILSEIAHLFPRFAIQDENKTLKADLWTEVLEDMEYGEIHKALMKYARSEERGFAPSAGQLIELTKPEEDPLRPKDHEYFTPEDIFDE